MDRALIVASFGTSVPEARVSVAAVEDALWEAAPGYRRARAFTSPTIRRILASRGEQVPSLPEALAELQASGVRRAAIQPTHLLYGIEYDKLKAETEKFTQAFETLPLGRPLLAETAHIQAFAAKLSEDDPPEDGGAVVFMGHGTEHFANAVYPALQTALRLEGREDMLVGTVEGWPSLEDVVRQLEPGGPKRVRLVPLMLVAGEHARNDMAGEWKSRLEECGHAVSCCFIGLGQRPWVRGMYQERLVELLERVERGEGSKCQSV